MTIREKVIKGLECCALTGLCHDKGCPYIDNETCVDDLCNDALALIQPRVMTLEDVENTIKELAPLWVELHPIINDSEGGSAWRMGWTYSEFGKPKKYMMENYISRLTLTEPTYGKTWRCWTSRPDEKVRAETPWQPQ